MLDFIRTLANSFVHRYRNPASVRSFLQHDHRHCIIVIKKSKKDNKTLFIDASAEFVRGGNKNKLSDENRTRILKAFTKRADIEHFARLVNNRAIRENDYNIAVSSHVAQRDTREVIDITKLNAEIDDIVARQNELRTSIDEIVVDLEGGRQ